MALNENCNCARCNELAKFAERYSTICNLIEAIWLKRNDEDYYNIDLANLTPMTSPQARKIANFIEHLYEKE